MDRETQTCSETVYPPIVRREHQTQSGGHTAKQRPSGKRTDFLTPHLVS